MMTPWTMVPPLFLLALLLTACGGPPEVAAAYELAGSVELEERVPENGPGLHNVFRLSDAIFSGSEPHGDAALRRISEMGVKTVLSVDGKAPDAETASKYGMRYVHVPIQYSGISARDRLRIAKVFRELEGPFYVHCFHGKHRGPAAAALGRVVLDGASREQAIAEMRHWCGTSGKYAGLYETVARAALPSASETATSKWDFPAAHRAEGFRQAMIEAARPFDHLKSLAQRGWAADPEHPDLNAAHEAARMLELFEAAVALEEVQRKPDDFRAWLDESVEQARALAAALQAPSVGEGALDPAAAAFRLVGARCDDCHRKYRNE